MKVLSPTAARRLVVANAWDLAPVTAEDAYRRLAEALDAAAADVRAALRLKPSQRLAPDEAARFIHRRLHAGVERLRRLPAVTADAPEVLARARSTPCADCIEANATRHAHTQRAERR